MKRTSENNPAFNLTTKILNVPIKHKYYEREIYMILCICQVPNLLKYCLLLSAIQIQPYYTLFIYFLQTEIQKNII